MGISSFAILAKANASYNINNVFLTPSLEFPEIPADNVQVLQVQIETDQASILEVTTNGASTWSKLNNGTAIDGLATFTMLVQKGDVLNFRNTDVAGLLVKIVVAS